MILTFHLFGDFDSKYSALLAFDMCACFGGDIDVCALVTFAFCLLW